MEPKEKEEKPKEIPKNVMTTTDFEEMCREGHKRQPSPFELPPAVQPLPASTQPTPSNPDKHKQSHES